MTVNENSKPLLTVKGLKQYFKVSNNYTCLLYTSDAADEL